MNMTPNKCLRCFKNSAIEGYLYCAHCMEHFPQCKTQKKLIFKSKKQKEVEKQLLIKMIKRLNEKIKTYTEEIKKLEVEQ